jgi:hypothetical protein
MYNVTTDARGQRMSFNMAIMGLNQALATPAQLQAYLNDPVNTSLPDKVANAVLSQSLIRLEQPLVTNTNQFVFAVLNNQGPAARVTEIRLAPQDAFYVSAMRLTTSISTPGANASAMVLNTWPNPNTYTTSGSAAAMETIYNGYLNLTVNKDVVIPNLPLMLFRQVQETQFTAASNSPVDQFDGGLLTSLQPNPVLVGQKGSVITLVLPASLAAVTPNTILVLELYGVLAQNVTVTS